MRKYIKIAIAILIISIIAYLGVSIAKKINYKNQVAERIKIIPNFSFFTLNNTSFTEKEIAKNSNTLFVYFSTECEFCQHEVKQISENLQKFKNTQLIFVSFEEIDNIKTFAIEYDLLNKENVVFLQDKKLEFSEIFDAKSIPFMLLYDTEQKLIEKFKGATKVEKIIELLK